MSSLSEIQPAARYAYVIDDDADVAASACFITRTFGMTCRAFTSRSDFLDAAPDLEPGCILHDVRMPGMSYATMRSELDKLGGDWAVVFMSGSPEVSSRVARAGEEAHILEKPFDEQNLLRVLNAGFDYLGKQAFQHSAPSSVLQ